MNKGASKEEAKSMEHLDKRKTKTCAAHQFFKCRGLLDMIEQGWGKVGEGYWQGGLWS